MLPVYTVTHRLSRGHSNLDCRRRTQRHLAIVNACPSVIRIIRDRHNSNPRIAKAAPKRDSGILLIDQKFPDSPGQLSLNPMLICNNN